MEIDKEDAKTIIEGIGRLAGEGLLSDSLCYLGIRLMKVYFPGGLRPYWVKKEEWWKDELH